MTTRPELIRNAVVDQGFRWTRARQAIVETIVSCEGHITADDLAIIVRKNAPRVGRMTVYRTLELLSQIGILRPIYQGTGAAHYILMIGGSHHHLICNRCHTVIEFDDCTAGEFAEGVGERFGFYVSGHLLELYGLCPECRMGG